MFPWQIDVYKVSQDFFLWLGPSPTQHAHLVGSIGSVRSVRSVDRFPIARRGQSAIDSAQSDHEMVIQSIVNNKDI